MFAKILVALALVVPAAVTLPSRAESVCVQGGVGKPAAVPVDAPSLMSGGDIVVPAVCVPVP